VSPLSIAAISVALVCAGVLLVRHGHLETPLEYSTLWMAGGDIVVRVGFLIDPLSLLMLTIVAVICFLVQVYSLGYMAGDPGFARYYAFMSLFAWAMMNLTLAPTLLQLYIFWELVGLSSYLLIGFWYEKFSASEAGKKAFVMTRLGDVAFFIGILLILLNFGNLSIPELNSPGQVPAPAVITVSALLIFGGVMGKSAQFPLLTWLPDAMEGPTPVSALLHSATMVAAALPAGPPVPFSACRPRAGRPGGGAVSMPLSATMAMVSRDIKRSGPIPPSVSWADDYGACGRRLRGGCLPPHDHAGFRRCFSLPAGSHHACGGNDMFESGAGAAGT
jgi:NADH-quinone oxidoreductase subunit L